jgi:hypothetical protein
LLFIVYHVSLFVNQEYFLPLVTAHETIIREHDVLVIPPFDEDLLVPKKRQDC